MDNSHPKNGNVDSFTTSTTSLFHESISIMQWEFLCTNTLYSAGVEIKFKIFWDKTINKCHIGISTDGLFIYINDITCMYNCKCENACNQYYLKWVGESFSKFPSWWFPIFYCKLSFARRAWLHLHGLCDPMMGRKPLTYHLKVEIITLPFHLKP